MNQYLMDLKHSKSLTDQAALREIIDDLHEDALQERILRDLFTPPRPEFESVEFYPMQEGDVDF